jgi:putative oxidoreductase
MMNVYNSLHTLLNKSLMFEGIAPLLLRLYLALAMIQAGWNKYQSFEGIVDWIGDSLDIDTFDGGGFLSALP